jgi:DNA polymerase III delta prime subunit
VADPFVLRPHGLAFDELNDLRRYLERLLRHASPSIAKYYDDQSGGFVHLLDPEHRKGPGHFSNASTATCLAFLTDSGRWASGEWAAKQEDLRSAIIGHDDWTSADLPPDNAFTVPFLLDAIYRLGGTRGLNTSTRKEVQRHLDEMKDSVRKGNGGVSVANFPPAAFLTFKVVRVLQTWGQLDDELRSLVAGWAWPHLYQESVQISAARPDADVFELAYSVLTVSTVQSLDELKPQERESLRFAITQFFEHQNDSGTWPRSRPLFVYPGLGNAYCYDYELLTYMLADSQITHTVLENLPRLRKAALALDDAKFPLDDEAVGWASGHLRKASSAESWSTASVFHFCHLLDRLVADAIRREVFRYAGAEYHREAAVGAHAFDGFLDSSFRDQAKTRRLRSVLEASFLRPLASSSARVRQGHPIPKNVAISAILYGPPGTSKTQLARAISRYLGWPLLALDPSHLTRDGMDRLHAETNRLFGMLEASEEIVVLLDEFDELVRTRETGSEIESRFLTTAMLPKLAALSNRRRIVFLLATNHLENFDAAISRRGRFDMIVPVLPPMLREKLAHWPQVKQRFQDLGIDTGLPQYRTLKRHLDELTFHEFEELVPQLLAVPDQAALLELAKEEHERSTLGRPPSDPIDEVSGGNWAQRIARQSHNIRIPQPPTAPSSADPAGKSA